MFSTDFDISDPLNWLLLSLVTMLLALLVWIIFKNRTLSPRKRGAKLLLNIFLWTITLGFLLQPYWKLSASSQKLLVPGNDVPDDWATHLKDSLGIDEIQSQDDFDEMDGDTIVLAGQDYQPEFLSKLSRSGPHTLKWIPYYQTDHLQEISWEGVLRKGQIQQVYGTIQSSREQQIKLRYAGNTLDSVSLKKGFNRFDLKFPVFVQGSIAATLDLGQTALDTIRFFARPNQTRTYQFVLDSPDFETRTLANWLGQNGHSVLISSKISKNVTSNKTINKAAEPDIYITDPSNSSDPIIKEALASGKSILLMGLNDVEKDFVVVNQALGSNLNVTRTSTDENVPIVAGLTAWPYKFISSARTFNFPDMPVAVTKAKGRVGVSLLNETFPMMLSGDSLGYSKIWTEILARISPPDSANVSIKAPIFSGQDTRIDFNNSKEQNLFSVKNQQDTLFTQSALLNEKTDYARFIPIGAGEWNEFDGAFADTKFYVEPGNSMRSVKQSRLLKKLAATYKSAESIQISSSRINRQVPGYAWFLLFLIAFTALWAEAKFA
jgi:hypothetical protein